MCLAPTEGSGHISGDCQLGLSCPYSLSLLLTRRGGDRVGAVLLISSAASAPLSPPPPCPTPGLLPLGLGKSKTSSKSPPLPPTLPSGISSRRD